MRACVRCLWWTWQLGWERECDHATQSAWIKKRGGCLRKRCDVSGQHRDLASWGTAWSIYLVLLIVGSVVSWRRCRICDGVQEGKRCLLVLGVAPFALHCLSARRRCGIVGVPGRGMSNSSWSGGLVAQSLRWSVRGVVSALAELWLAWFVDFLSSLSNFLCLLDSDGNARLFSE